MSPNQEHTSLMLVGGVKDRIASLYSEVGSMKSQPITNPANLNCGFAKLNLDG